METAGRMFYEHGVTATGVDAIVRAAEVSKPTLYAHFPSKSALLAAALEERHRQRVEQLEDWLATVDDVRLRPLAVFGWLGRFYATDGARGCGFLNAAAELPDADDPARQVVRREKHWLLALLTTLCREARLDRPERVASQLLLLVDGVAGRVVVEGPAAAPAALADATAVATLLVDRLPVVPGRATSC